MKKKTIVLLFGIMVFSTTLSACNHSDTQTGFTMEKVMENDRMNHSNQDLETKLVTDTTGSTETTDIAESNTMTAVENDTIGEAKETNQNEAVTIRVGYMPNYGSLWSIGSAMQQKLFDDGVTIELVEFQDGPSIIAELEAGNLDVGYVGQGAHKVVIQNGLKIFALSHVANADMIISRDSIKEIFDLKGKKVGYIPETSSQLILEVALASEGLSMADITALTLEECNTGSFAEALSKGVIDAVAVWSPESLDILDSVDGVLELADNMSVPDMPISLSSWICTADYAEQHRDTLKRFAHGLFQGMSYGAKEHQDEIALFVANQTGVTIEEAYAQRGDADWYTAENLESAITSGTLESFYQMQQNGFVAAGDVTPTDVKDYVLIDFMLEAVKK